MILYIALLPTELSSFFTHSLAINKNKKVVLIYDEEIYNDTGLRELPQSLVNNELIADCIPSKMPLSFPQTMSPQEIELKAIGNFEALLKAKNYYISDFDKIYFINDSYDAWIGIYLNAKKIQYYWVQNIVNYEPPAQVTYYSDNFNRILQKYMVTNQDSFYCMPCIREESDETAKKLNKNNKNYLTWNYNKCIELISKEDWEKLFAVFRIKNFNEDENNPFVSTMIIKNSDGYIQALSDSHRISEYMNYYEYSELLAVMDILSIDFYASDSNKIYIKHHIHSFKDESETKRLYGKNTVCIPNIPFEFYAKYFQLNNIKFNYVIGTCSNSLNSIGAETTDNLYMLGLDFSKTWWYYISIYVSLLFAQANSYKEVYCNAPILSQAIKLADVMDFKASFFDLTAEEKRLNKNSLVIIEMGNCPNQFLTVDEKPFTIIYLNTEFNKALFNNPAGKFFPVRIGKEKLFDIVSDILYRNEILWIYSNDLNIKNYVRNFDFEHVFNHLGMRIYSNKTTVPMALDMFNKITPNNFVIKEESLSTLKSEPSNSSDILSTQISKNFDYKANILQTYYEAEKKGLDIRKFFEMFDWLNPSYKIAFYAIDEFGAMVYRICQKCGLNFSVFLSDQDRELTCIAPDNSKVDLSCNNIYYADKSLYDGIFAAITYNNKQLDILKNRGGLFLFDAIANYIYTKAYFIDRISEVIQKNPLVKTSIFITPTIYQLNGEKSEPEKYFMNNAQKLGGVCSIEDKFIGEKLKTALYKDYGFDDEYISEVCGASYPVNPQNSTMLMANHSGKYSNVINHRRLTTDTPKEYKNTIYFFGDSCVTGLYVGDGETIESYLQRKLNQNGIPYLVQNCANSYGKHYDWIFTLTESMQFKPGDILIFCSQVDWLTQQHLKTNDQKFLNGILGIYTFPLFQRPHNHGEVFSDAFHFNSKGNELIAEKIFTDLQVADYFNDNLKPTERTLPVALDEQEKAPITTQYSQELNRYLNGIRQHRPKIGSIVMNCNPFTLGHRYLIEYAASQVERLYIFVVEEDKSIFPFADRFDLVKKGTSDLPNVTVLPSGKFIISSLTFQQYFEKGELQDTVIDPSEDVEIFAKEIAPVMGITVRFAGEEPLDNVTRQYNESMRIILPQYGIEFVEIPRKKGGEDIISASWVRKLLETNDFDSIAKLVPKTTLEYLIKRGETHNEQK